MGKPNVITLDQVSDWRGTVSYANQIDITNFKRFYFIDHEQKNIVRAWQAHKKENKIFFTVAGSFMIYFVRIDNWIKPDNKLMVNKIELNAERPQLFHLPGGYANGIKSLKDHSKLLVLSDFGLKESQADTFRYDINLWCDWDNE